MRQVGHESELRFRDAGPHALLIECEPSLRSELTRQLFVLRQQGAIATEEIVPAAQCVLLDQVVDADRVRAIIAGLELCATRADAHDLVELPIRYDGSDLGEVARLWDCTENEVAATHQSLEFTVAFFGFAPGFVYCDGLPEHLQVPRQASPRVDVPALSVGLASTMTGIYPRATPGGWQLIGTVTEEYWFPDRHEPTQLTPGTRLKFLA